MTYRDVDALLARIARLERERARVRARARRIARRRRERTTSRVVFGLLATVVSGIVVIATTLASRREPELTPARVLEDLGRDELVVHFWTEPEEWETTRPCESRANVLSVNEERDAAVAAGLIERICKDVPIECA